MMIKLVTSLSLSRLDYCNSLLSSLPASSVQSLRRIQNFAARLILKKRKTYHIIPLFQFLHWFPIQQRIQYKINTLCYNCITGTAPSYLCDCLQLYTPSLTLRSASDTLSLQIPRTRLSTVGSRAFSVLGPSTWNMTFPFLSDRNPLWTHSNVNISFPQIVDLPCFLFHESLSIPSLPGVCCFA